MDPDRSALRSRLYGLALIGVLVVSGLEVVLALSAKRRMAGEADYAAAAQVVRSHFQEGDLITSGPRFIDPLVRKELGDLMPASMVGRADSAPYGRIWELSISGGRAEDTAGLAPEWQEHFGNLWVRRYQKQKVAVFLDLVAAFQMARVSLLSGASEAPCLYVEASPGRGGALPGFHCPSVPPEGQVVRRVMEIDYRPRYGIVVPLQKGVRTSIEWEIPKTVPEAAALHLWFGLHDYYARKTESGPVDVAIEMPSGQTRATVSVKDQGWQKVVVPLPLLGESGRSLRLLVSAKDARARFLGFAGQVRK